jgi:hypothetical protein
MASVIFSIGIKPPLTNRPFHIIQICGSCQKQQSPSISFREGYYLLRLSQKKKRKGSPDSLPVGLFIARRGALSQFQPCQKTSHCTAALPGELGQAAVKEKLPDWLAMSAAA